MLSPIEICSYNDFKSYFDGFPNSPHCPFFFRGISDEYELLPSICYSDLRDKITDYPKYQICIIDKFQKALEAYDIKLDKCNWTLWFLARHFGLKSKLLDFTKDATAAFQFAIGMSHRKSIKIYCLHEEGIELRTQNALDVQNIDPFEYEKMCLIQPQITWNDTFEYRLGLNRIAVQSAKFLYLPIQQVKIPLTSQIPEKFWKVFVVKTSNIPTIERDLINEGIEITNDLMLNRNHHLDQVCKNINHGCVSL